MKGLRATAGLRAVAACDLGAERRRLALLQEEEARARRDGFRSVAGVDEVGRGCLAGAVWAAAVVLAEGDPPRGLDDSKRLPAEVREDLSARIRRLAAGVGTGSASPAEVDVLGIVPATALAMRRALAALRASGTPHDAVLFDDFALPELGAAQRRFVGGDRRVAAIAAASIVAKVARDAEMDRWHREYPWYGFDANRGYGTAAHLEALLRHGPSPIHRLTFRRVLPRPGEGAGRSEGGATPGDVS